MSESGETTLKLSALVGFDPEFIHQIKEKHWQSFTTDFDHQSEGYRDGTIAKFQISDLIEQSKKQKLGKTVVFTRSVEDDEGKIAGQESFTIDFDNPGEVVYLNKVFAQLSEMAINPKAVDRIPEYLDHLTTSISEEEDQTNKQKDKKGQKI